jgi:nucleoside-diphosphate-sugar epimerase
VKKILVVGGAGYIGAHIAWLLQEGGYQVGSMMISLMDLNQELRANLKM